MLAFILPLNQANSVKTYDIVLQAPVHPYPAVEQLVKIV